MVLVECNECHVEIEKTTGDHKQCPVCDGWSGRW